METGICQRIAMNSLAYSMFLDIDPFSNSRVFVTPQNNTHAI